MEKNNDKLTEEDILLLHRDSQYNEYMNDEDKYIKANGYFKIVDLNGNNDECCSYFGDWVINHAIKAISSVLFKGKTCKIIFRGRGYSIVNDSRRIRIADGFNSILDFSCTDFVDNCAFKILHDINISYEYCEDGNTIKLLMWLSEILIRSKFCGGVIITASSIESTWYDSVDSFSKYTDLPTTIIKTPNSDGEGIIKTFIISKEIK